MEDEPRCAQTEEIDPSSGDLDLLGTADLLHRINDEDRRAAWAVEREIDVIASAVDAITERMRAGGKLHYFGAGTSGRLGVLDAAEMAPTFGVQDRVIAHLAGTPSALLGPVEGAEDDRQAGAEQARRALSSADVAIGISASGSAAYVLGAMEAARAQRALRVALTSDGRSPLARAVDVAIVLRTGPEVIAGSTRMKAGAAQKMALAMISTAVMVRLGLTYGNLMVGVQGTSTKLRARAERLVASIANVEAKAAATALGRANGEVKTAVVMLRRSCDAREARALLDAVQGSLRATLDR